ncbi:MAG TPA: DMT family transporter [Acidimicrobiales bacterium]|nr:DMT family transporter [Acidimicrobiales bacterium]
MTAATGDTQAAFTPSDWLLFASIAGIWGASFLFIAVGLEAFEPGVVTLLRVGLGALILALLPGPRVRIAPEDRRRLLFVSALWVGLPFTLFPIAEQHINSAVTGLLNGATPMFAASFAWLLYRRRTTGPQLAGVAIGFAGIVLISLPSLGEGSSSAWGVALVLVATACYGLSGHVALPLQQRYGSLVLMGRMLALATIWTLPYGLVGLPDSELELRPLLAVAVLGLLGTGLAFLIMGTLIGRVGSVRSAFITYLIPVVSLVLGVAFQDDHVEAPALAGVALVVVGAALAGRREA